jgi:hypothetical protein
MPRTPSLRSLFLTCVGFSLAFSTVFQAFLTTFLIDSGYKTSIQNVDEMFALGIKLTYPEEYNDIVESGDETEKSKVERNRVCCPPKLDCAIWAINLINVSILIHDTIAEENYANVVCLGENKETMLCRLEDGICYSKRYGMIMFYGDPLMGRGNKDIERVFQPCIHNYWIPYRLNLFQIRARKIAVVHPLDGYYNFNLYHMQPASCLLLIGFCISAFCFTLELVYNHVLHKRI